MLLLQSSQFTYLWFFKLKYVMFSPFQTIFSLLIVWLLYKHHLALGWKSKCFIDFLCCLSSAGFWYCWVLEQSPEKLAQNSLSILSSLPPDSNTLVRQLGHWMQLSQEKDHFLANSWVIIKIGVWHYKDLFWKSEIPLWKFLGVMLPLFSYLQLSAIWMIYFLGENLIKKNPQTQT